MESKSRSSIAGEKTELPIFSTVSRAACQTLASSGAFPRSKHELCRDVSLTAHVYLLPRFGMHGPLPPHSLLVVARKIYGM